MEKTHGMSIWTDLDIAKEGITEHKVGPVNLFFQRVENELWIAYTYDSKDAKKKSADLISNKTEDEDLASVTSESKDITELKWNRWALDKPAEQICIRPVFPDRAVVVKPEFPFKIGRDASAQVYTRIPVFIRITPKDDKNHIITDIPTVKITGTWFGDFLEGELCYWITSKARRTLTDNLFEPHLVVCPIMIRNLTKEDLPIDKMSLQVSKMSIYQTAETMWADQTLITYLGGDKHSNVEMAGRAPKEAEKATLISEPRNPVKRSLAVRTFRKIKDLSFSPF